MADVHEIIQRPVADYSVTWGAATDNYMTVSDQNDATRIYGPPYSGDKCDRFSFDPLPAEALYIARVDIWYKFGRHAVSSLDRICRSVWTLDGQSVYGVPSATVLSGLVTVLDYAAIRPGGGQWTPEDVNSCVAGYQCLEEEAEPEIAEFWRVIRYYSSLDVDAEIEADFSTKRYAYPDAQSMTIFAQIEARSGNSRARYSSPSYLEEYPVTLPPPNYVFADALEARTLTSPDSYGLQHRRPKWAVPLHNFTLQYTALTSAQLQTLLDFYNARKGSGEVFYWNNPNDNLPYLVRFIEDSIDRTVAPGEPYCFQVQVTLEEARIPTAADIRMM